MTEFLQNKDYLISLGVTHILNWNISIATLREQVAQITNTSITYIFNMVSFKETQQATLYLLALEGTLAVVTQAQVNGEKGNKKVFIVIGSFHFPQNCALSAKFSIALTKWPTEGEIKVCTTLAYAVDSMTMEFGQHDLQPNKVEVLPEGLKDIVLNFWTHLSYLIHLSTHPTSSAKLVLLHNFVVLGHTSPSW